MGLILILGMRHAIKPCNQRFPFLPVRTTRPAKTLMLVYVVHGVSCPWKDPSLFLSFAHSIAYGGGRNRIAKSQVFSINSSRDTVLVLLSFVDAFQLASQYSIPSSRKGIVALLSFAVMVKPDSSSSNMSLCFGCRPAVFFRDPDQPSIFTSLPPSPWPAPLIHRTLLHRMRIWPRSLVNFWSMNSCAPVSWIFM